MVRKIGIIGAGVSGILACKYCLSKGYHTVVFDLRATIGGVWTNTSQTTRLQSSKLFYQFSDFPWPDTVTEEFPSGQQVQDYLYSYATHYNLLSHIIFNSKVVKISYQGSDHSETNTWSLWGDTGDAFSSKGNWNISVQNTKSLSTEDYTVDFVIMCVGRFSDVPNIPEFPHDKGPDAFDGEVIHSMDYANMDNSAAVEFIKGKRVTVVGFRKSALDIAMECSTVNGEDKPCTLIYRTKRWHLPDFYPWGVPLPILYLNRFAELLIHKPGEGLGYRMLATMLSPLRWVISKFVESAIKSKLQLTKFEMVPKHSFLNDMNSSLLAILPKDFYNRVEKGLIKLKEAKTFYFDKDGILIDGAGESVKTDLVILATGFSMFKKLKNIFASVSFQKFIAGPADTVVPLYRDCIHPRIPQMAIIGFSLSLSDLYTSEMRCRWVAELLDGTIKLPSIGDMEKDVKKWDKHMRKYAGDEYGRSSFSLIGIWYNDLLCKDMGWNSRRKKGFFAELFEPYGPSDYNNEVIKEN